jgi:DNA-binding response OmpR family regulator
MTHNHTILVVDDNQELRQGLTAMLGQRGYRTLEADDGFQARELIDVYRPDVVILDMMMPRWGGLAVLEHFRGKADAPRFIMITANEGQRHKSYAEQLGIVDYIHKPFSMERLLEGVGKVVRPPSVAQLPAPVKETPSTIRCRCRGCGSRIKAAAKLLGQMRTCPGCRAAFTVAPEVPEDEDVKLVMDNGLPLAPPRRPRM